MFQVWTIWTICQLLSQQGCLYYFGSNEARSDLGRQESAVINQPGQLNHAYVETEPGEPENQEEVLFEGEEVGEEGNEQQD
jgi:hypothetical protein